MQITFRQVIQNCKFLNIIFILKTSAELLKTKAMNIAKNIVQSFENLIIEVIEGSGAVFYELCFSEKHKKNIYISAPFFLVEAYQNYLSKKMEVDPSNLDHRFMGIKMIPSTDHAITLFHKDYVVYKEDWMIRKMPLTPGLIAHLKERDSSFALIIKPFIPGDITCDDPSLN